MAKNKIVWSVVAKRKLSLILNFFIERNKSEAYSIKLYKKFQKELTLVGKSPEIGLPTDMQNIRGLIVGD